MIDVEAMIDYLEDVLLRSGGVDAFCDIVGCKMK